MSYTPWSVEVYSVRYQKEPQTFSGSTETQVRTNVYNWLLANHPTYLKSGKSTLWKEGQLWNLSSGTLSNRKQDEHVYRTFCDSLLDICLEPREQEKRNIQKRVSKLARPSAISCSMILLFALLMGCMFFFSLLAPLSFASSSVPGPLIIVIVCIFLALLVVYLLFAVYNNETEEKLHKWLKTYGIKTLATIKDRRTDVNQESTRCYLKYTWFHSETSKHYSTWCNTSHKIYEASPLQSTHTILLDPHDATTFQILPRGQHQAIAWSVWGIGVEGVHRQPITVRREP